MEIWNKETPNKNSLEGCRSIFLIDGNVLNGTHFVTHCVAVYESDWEGIRNSNSEKQIIVYVY